MEVVMEKRLLKTIEAHQNDCSMYSLARSWRVAFQYNSTPSFLRNYINKGSTARLKVRI